MEIRMNKEEKFMLIYKRYQRLLFGIGKRILRDDSDVDDALQQCWIAVSKNLDKLDPERESKTRNYCCTVMKHAALRIYKTRNEKFKANAAGTAIFSLDDDLLYTENNTVSEYDKIEEAFADTELPAYVDAGFQKVFASFAADEKRKARRQARKRALKIAVAVIAVLGVSFTGLVVSAEAFREKVFDLLFSRGNGYNVVIPFEEAEDAKRPEERAKRTLPVLRGFSRSAKQDSER
jgi:RNA polymerase sigma factor (sigma-70 family)